MHLLTFNLAFPFGRITGIRFFGYNLSPLFYGTPCLLDAQRYVHNFYKDKYFDEYFSNPAG